MTQELIDLRNCILAGRYEEALQLVDELEGMSRKAILQAIESFLVRLLVHLIKNQVEQRLTNSWAASIRDSVLKIQSLNLKLKFPFDKKVQPMLSKGFQIFARSVTGYKQGNVKQI